MKTKNLKPSETMITHDMLLQHAENVTGVPAKYHRGYTCQEILKVLEKYHHSIVSENDRIRRQISVLVVKLEDEMQVVMPF
jgi:hypothetical protein